MLLGVTTLGGDEPLGGWNIPERPEALFATTNFDLNTVVASPFCNVDLSGVILQLDTPLSTDQFERGREFSDILTGSVECIGLDAQLTLPCFPDEIPRPPEVPGLVVPASYFLNAEFGTYGVQTQPIMLDKSGAAVHPGNVTLMQTDVVYYDNSLTNNQAKVTQLIVDVVTPSPGAERGYFIVHGQDATLTYSGA